MLRGGADVICPPRDGVCKKWVVVEQRRGLGLLMSRHVRRGRLYQGEGAFPVLLRISEEAQAGLCDVVVSGGIVYLERLAASLVKQKVSCRIVDQHHPRFLDHYKVGTDMSDRVFEAEKLAKLGCQSRGQLWELERPKRANRPRQDPRRYGAGPRCLVGNHSYHPSV